MIEVDRAPGIRPRPSFARSLDAAARASLPFAMTLGLVLFAGALAGLPGEEAMRPAIALCCVFAWTLHRPALMPPPAVFLIGLVCDLLGWVPLGTMTLVLLATQAVALRVRPSRVAAGFLACWASFVVTAAAAAALLWASVSLLGFQLLPWTPAIRTWGFAAVLFPSVVLLTRLLARSAAAPERA
jgi:rod shape-determining protein MreD